MQRDLGSRLRAPPSQEDLMRYPIVLLTLASAALAADSTWIEHAGGVVARDGAGKIVAVDLRSSWVTDSDMPLLARMPDLQRLDLTLTRISDRGLRALKTAPAIEDLNLFFAEQITDEGAATVKGWKHLRRLNLRGNKLTDTSLEFLRQMPQIEYLDLGGTQRTDSGLWALQLSDAGMQSIASVA